MQTKIANTADLKSAATVLHDARFTADAIDFDKAAHTFTLKCWVRESKVKDFGPVQAWRAHRLFFANVSECKVDVKENVFYYELATIRFNKRDSRLDLIVHYAVEISLQLEKLDGTLIVTNESRKQWVKPESS